MEVDAPQQPQEEEDLPLVRNVIMSDGRSACLSLSRMGAAAAGAEVVALEDGSIGLKVCHPPKGDHYFLPPLRLSFLYTSTRARTHTGATGGVLGGRRGEGPHQPQQPAARAGVGGERRTRAGKEGGAADPEAAGSGARPVGGDGCGGGGGDDAADGEAAKGTHVR